MLAGALAVLTWRTLSARRSLAGQVAVVMGGSRGLGLAIARELAGRGARLALCARDRGPLERARRELESGGATVTAATCDVSDRAQVERFLDAVTRRYGHIDVLVNNASTIEVGPLSSLTLEDFERAMAVDFWGTVYATLHVLPAMRVRRHGSIVNITSIGGKVSIPHLLPYGCAKFAAVGFSEGLRAELRRDGVVVTTVVPGLMRTGSPLHASWKGDAAAEFRWFALGGVQPLTAISAHRAARRVVRALERGESEVTLGLPAGVLRVFAGVAPRLLATAVELLASLLPRPRGAPGPARRGAEAGGRSSTRWLVEAEGRDFNQLDGR